VDDVITTGGSTLQAVEAVEAAGGRVAFVLALVDRQEGGRENIEKRGYTVVPNFHSRGAHRRRCRPNGATGVSDMAGKATRVVVERCGKQPRYNEVMWGANLG
jgi:hypothetical protein